MCAIPAGALAPFVPASWWQEHRRDCVTADMRWYLDGRSGAGAYARGHLAGAVWVDLDRWLAGAAGARGRHPLPSPEQFAAGMGGLGIGDDDVVVAYDDAGGVVAARLVWMLRSTGHRAAVLDGGIDAVAEPRSTRAEAREPKAFTPHPWPAGLLVDADQAAAPGHVLLDARDTDRFEGRVEPVDPRPGHVPGAVSLPARATLRDGRVLPAGELREAFGAAGVEDGGAVVASCGSGVTACHTLLALEAAGLGPGRLYPGSYSEWSRSERPVERGGVRSTG